MNTDMDSSNSDEYYVTALQIFDYCGAESSGTLRVDALMDKFAPFIKTNKEEYSYLKSLLDPEEENPAITVTKLATALHKYSESQKCKVDLDESFNLRCGQAPQDSDSGISTDGFQLLEDLQCELREKAHLAHQLRTQLDFTDRQHEEALATLTAERDTLTAHLNMLREENIALSHVRRDYEEACERLLGSERALGDARADLERVRRRARLLHDQAAALETDKASLQDLLAKSKDECHRMNEMYASRQSALLEHNEALRAERAELAARLRDQAERAQLLAKEKIILEMELKDVLNRSSQAPLPLDRSIEVSYTEEQMLTALDSLNADSRFSQDNRLLDEESFLNALKEDQGRATNMSLFDEIRLSFNHNASRYLGDQSDRMRDFDVSTAAVETQTDAETNTSEIEDTGTQTDYIGHACECLKLTNAHTQTENNNNNTDSCLECPKCLDCEALKANIQKLEFDKNKSQRIVKETQLELIKYEDNLSILQKLVSDGNGRNSFLQAAVDSLQAKIKVLEVACDGQKEIIEGISCDVRCVQSQTEFDETVSVSTQVETPCGECVKRRAPQRSLRRYFWEAVKCLFQVFAVLCFAMALGLLSGVWRGRGACRTPRAPTPWRWLHVQDLMDLLLPKVEYVAEVPM